MLLWWQSFKGALLQDKQVCYFFLMAVITVNKAMTTRADGVLPHFQIFLNYFMLWFKIHCQVSHLATWVYQYALSTFQIRLFFFFLFSFVVASLVSVSPLEQSLWWKFLINAQEKKDFANLYHFLIILEKLYNCATHLKSNI